LVNAFQLQLLLRLCIVAALSHSALAHADDVRDAIGRSSFVGVVTISAGDQMPNGGGEESNCGASYTAYANAKRVFVNEINWIEGSPVHFRMAESLDLGGSYLVFLSEGVVENIKHVGPIDRELRTNRCKKAGVRLVPVLFETEHWKFNAVFPQWRLLESTNAQGERKYRRHFLVVSAAKEFFGLPIGANHYELKFTSIDIQRPIGVVKSIAYDSDELLEMVADIGCNLRDHANDANDAKSELEIAKCTQ